MMQWLKKIRCWFRGHHASVPYSTALEGTTVTITALWCDCGKFTIYGE